MREIIDAIIGPAKELLEKIVEWLSSITILASRGLDIEKYLGFFNYMGDNWILLIKNISLAAIFVLTIRISVSVWSLYLKLKKSVKWW